MAETHTIEYVWLPARPHVFTPGRARAVETIVMHSTCGRQAADLAILTGETERHVSVHWYINRAGQVYHLVDDSDTAWHAGRVKDESLGNAASVGIEMEHFDPDAAHPDGEDWPDVQVQQAARLCAYLLKEHRLGLDAIRTHAEVAAPPGRKSDPVAFPWERFHQLLASKLTFDWRVAPAPTEGRV